MKTKAVAAVYVGLWVAASAIGALSIAESTTDRILVGIAIFLAFFAANAMLLYWFRSRQTQRAGNLPTDTTPKFGKADGATASPPEETESLWKAPWSNQPVSVIVRVGAAFFVLCGVFALGAGIYFVIVEGIKPDQTLFVVSLFVGIPYTIWLFGHVVVCGKAPAGWLPSWSKSQRT
jgi:hypothetical protein